MGKGIVKKSTGSWYEVLDESGNLVPCRIRGRFRMDGIKSTNPVAVGDVVEFSLKEGQEDGVITKILPRKNYIVRKSVNLSKRAHILAANLDQAIIVVTLAAPKTLFAFVDRFLATTEAYRVPAILLFNKLDLYSEDLLAELEYQEAVYQNAGYQTLRASAETGEGLESLKRMLHNKTTLICGHSGVGKSTIINKIEPLLNLKTAEISETHLQGQHTTTFAEMHKLGFGGYIIDTPGIRGFGLFDMKPEEIHHYFPEIFHLSHQCKFHNCLHVHEPGCAVVNAVENNELAFTRYESYLNILNHLDDENPYRTDIYAE